VRDPRETAFDQAMMNIYVRAKAEANYTASIFHRMLCDQGGLATAKQLINDRKPSEGYTALWERGRLDLTVEAVVTDTQEWHDLFEPEEIARARKRLADYGHSAKERASVEPTSIEVRFSRLTPVRRGGELWRICRTLPRQGM
jgi:hypothetical protein